METIYRLIVKNEKGEQVLDYTTNRIKLLKEQLNNFEDIEKIKRELSSKR